jgi:4-carboxymuconolactone decarboxylase
MSRRRPRSRPLARGDLTAAEYATAEAVLEPRGLVELTTLVGYYALLALQLRVFRLQG